MKAFIFVALVASVAARSLDLQTIQQLNKEKSLLNTPLVTKVDDELLLKEQQKLNKNIVLGQQENVLDTTTTGFPVQDKTVGGIYNYDNVVVDDVDRVLSFQELYTTELFKEYLTLPLFRQYIQYPSFQRFVGSVYFQRFYQLPAYKQYFVNPVLFYKYVYPIVQLFNTEYTLPSVYGQHEDVLGLQTLVDNVLLKNKNFLPYAYNYNNQRYTVPTTTFQGQTTNYKFLLEKLYKTLIAQEQQQQVYQPITQIKTDVKLFPEQKVVVEPFTNQVVVEEPKVVDVQVDTIVPVTDKQVIQDTVVLTQEDVVLLKQLLQRQIITPEVYQAVVLGKINYTTVLRQVIARGVSTELLSQIVARLQVIDTVVPVVDSVVLNERQIVILKDLLHKQFITPEVYQQILLGKIDFPVVLRQVLERRGITTELINLIINRLVLFVEPQVQVPVVTEQDIYIVKELLRQNIITPQVYQYFVAGKYDLFTILHQVIVRRDVIDSIYPVVDTTVVLTERNIALLKDLFRQQIISHDVYEAVLVGKVDFVTVLRQVLERRGINEQLITLIINRLLVVDSVVPVTTEQEVYLFKQLYRQNLISYEIYQAVIYGKIDFFTVLRQIIFRTQVVDSVVPYNTINNRFAGNDRYNYNTLINKLYGYKNLYNTEYQYPTIRENTFNYNQQRFPIVA